MHLRPWTRADVPVCAALMAEANRTDTLSRFMTPDLDSMDTSYRLSAFRFIRRSWLTKGRLAFVLVARPEELLPGNSTEPSKSPSEPQQQASQADTSSVQAGETEVIVGWAWFSRKGTSETAKYWQNQQLSASKSLERMLVTTEFYITNFIPNYDPALNHKNFSALGDILMNDPWDESIFAESWEVDGLFVDVKYQRRGYVRTMLDWVFEQARKEKVPVCVKGSARGGLAYRKHGFRSIGDVGFHKYFDELEYGGELHQLWVWEPEGLEDKWLERAKQKYTVTSGAATSTQNPQ